MLRYLIHNKDREHSAAMSLLSNQKEEASSTCTGFEPRELFLCEKSTDYESWVVPAGVPSALADIGGGVGANN